MTTTQPRYAHSKIYKLINTVDDKCFIGSTCSSLTKKLSENKKIAATKLSTVNRYYNQIGWHRVDIVLIHEFICDNKDQLNREEQRCIDLMNPILNKSGIYLYCPHGNLYSQCRHLCAGKRDTESYEEFRARHCMLFCEIHADETEDDEYEPESDSEEEFEPQVENDWTYYGK